MFALEHILCPIDFSPTSRHALDYAVGLASGFGARISALYVHRPTVPLFAAAPLVAPAFAEVPMDEQERIDILTGMGRFVEADRAAGVPIELVVRNSPRVPSTIVEVADELRVDMIAMGTEGRSGMKRLLLGSVAEGVLRLARRPVLTVTPRLAPAAPATVRALERIVCAVDWSANARRALLQAIALCEASGARLTVAHILDLPAAPGIPGESGGDERLSRFREAHQRLDAFIAADAAACAIDPILLAGVPSDEIIRLALEQQASLVVIGAHGRGIIDAVLRGTTTEQIVRQAPCPVLTVRA